MNWKTLNLQIPSSCVFLSFPNCEIETVSLLPMGYDLYFNSFITVCGVLLQPLDEGDYLFKLVVLLL